MPMPLHYSEIVRNLRRHRFSFMSRATRASFSDRQRPYHPSYCDFWFNSAILESFVFDTGGNDNVIQVYSPEKTNTYRGNARSLMWYMENLASCLPEDLIPIVHPADLVPIEDEKGYTSSRGLSCILSGTLYESVLSNRDESVSAQPTQIKEREASFLRRFNNLDMAPVR